MANLFDSITGIPIMSGFKLQAEVAIDPRFVVNTYEDLKNLVIEKGAYEGIKVYVKESKSFYSLKGTTSNDWVEDVSAGSTIYVLKTDVETDMVSDDETKIPSSAAVWNRFVDMTNQLKVSKSETNGKIKVGINGDEITVYTLPETVIQESNIATDAEVTSMLDEVFSTSTT